MTDRETGLLHFLVAEAGGYGVTIIRNGVRMTGWNTGRKAGSFIAIADLIKAVESSAATVESVSAADFDDRRAVELVTGYREEDLP
jgi:hypothetical protein